MCLQVSLTLDMLPEECRCTLLSARASRHTGL
uniref:Uncharacterized protein n=1 Tax=Anguilla anguilla TaxID=7936 RepID=A0A0E9VBH7_ANGAN